MKLSWSRSPREVLAWHFTPGWSLRDGTPLRTGETYRVPGTIAMGRRGLHGTRLPMAALQHAPGNVVSLVRLTGRIQEKDGILCASERTVLAAADATTILHEFALTCAHRAWTVLATGGHLVDQQSLNALAVKRRWLHNDATLSELLDACRLAEEAERRFAWAVPDWPIWSARHYASAASRAAVDALAAAEKDICDGWPRMRVTNDEWGQRMAAMKCARISAQLQRRSALARCHWRREHIVEATLLRLQNYTLERSLRALLRIPENMQA